MYYHCCKKVSGTETEVKIGIKVKFLVSFIVCTVENLVKKPHKRKLFKIDKYVLKYSAAFS